MLAYLLGLELFVYSILQCFVFVAVWLCLVIYLLFSLFGCCALLVVYLLLCLSVVFAVWLCFNDPTRVIG